MKNGYKFEFPKYNFILKPSWSQVVETLEMLEEKQHELVVIDVETPNNVLSAIGLAWNREDAISIPLYMGDRSNYWSFEQELELWKLLAGKLPKLNLGNQNVIFDWRVMEEHGVYLKMPTWDPMLMHHCLYSEMRHKLEIIISIYTNLPFYKRDEKEEKGSSIHPGKEMKHWEYNCMDCIGALWAIEELKEELIEEDMLDVYLDLYAEVIPPIFRMNMDGVAVDMPRLELVQKDLKALVKDYTTKIVEETGIEVNANSPKQVGALLYDSMNMDKYKGGDTAKKTLEKLAYKYKTEVPTMIIDIRAARKELGLFSEKNIKNGRVRTEYSLSRTNTGRFVSRKAFARGGMNLQNVKRGEQRKFFIAEPGHILVSADQKQAEAMLVGWYAQDGNLIALFESGKSLHLENAYNLFGERITKNDPRYIIAKGCIHGGNYGLGPWKFAYMTGLPFTDAKNHLENYHATYPGIRNTFHANVQKDIRNGRTLYNPFGRREVFLGRFNDETFRAGYAFKPQSTVSDINKKALKFISKYYKPLLELHDGIIISVPESEIQDSIDAFCDAYDIRFKINDEEHTIPIEITCGPNWEDQTVIY
jgi:DNA polymerase-1